jgi:cell shape-determining protein MreC
MIGTVEDVLPDSNGLTKRATIRPSVDFRRLEEVMVIRGLLDHEEDIQGEVMDFSIPPDMITDR